MTAGPDVATPLADLAAPDGQRWAAEALGEWLPQQRWFQGKARTVTAVHVADVALLADDLVDLFVDVRYADGGTERYQVPLVAVRDAADPAVAEDERLGVHAGVVLADATGDPRAAARFAALCTGAATVRTEDGARIGAGAGPTAAVREDAAPRRSSAEQSNTSIVFGDDAILKLFRRLEAGINPDVELTAALTAQGVDAVPRQRGGLLLQPDGDAEAVALAVLTDFVAGAREGWDAAVAEPGGGPVLDGAADLGRAVAEVHAALRAAFGVHDPTPEERRTAAGRLREDARRVLDLAAARNPELAAALLERVAAIDAVLGAVEEDALPWTRIHGDLHLGQVLLRGDGRWVVLDFEGEPARPLAERRAPASPLRDVAGMLRSFDYAAAYPSGAVDADGARWRDEARRRFLEGYAAASGMGTADARGIALERALAAYELDKALYELGYEIANRPAWVGIPIAGTTRILDRAAAAAQGADPTPGRNDVTERTPPPAADSAAPEREIDLSLELEAGADPGPVAPDVASAATVGASWRAHPDEVRGLLAGRHGNPHRLLGVHDLPDGAAVLRCYRPDAQSVEVVRAGADPVQAEQTAPGLFEARVPSRPQPADYRYRVRYAGGATFDVRDAYAFPATLGEVDLHLAGEGRHEELYKHLGAHVRTVAGVEGTSFAVWAPNARAVRVVGDFNSWDGRLNPMRTMGATGIWELFVPEVGAGTHYRFEVVTADGRVATRSDPYAQWTDTSPANASRVFRSRYTWGDDAWREDRARRAPLRAPVSIYEVHLGSWRWRHDDDGSRPLSYRELAEELTEYVTTMGFTHVELLPPAEHPYGGSWGYQVTGHFAPTSRFGDPDDFRYLVDRLHQADIGVIVDWVPAHFPKDEWALARFDGTALYEHADPRKGEHPDWGTLVFNFSRNEVRNFLLASALFWVEEMHVDGLRVDAVASMLYLDYSREAGQWVPNEFGGRENLEAVAFLKEFNSVVYGRNPHIITVAEESTAWPGVSRPAHLGGLGFGFKWNMGWMHDTLSYFSKDPVYRRYHHNQLTFGLLYAWSEHYVLPISHDEVVHGKRSLLDKMPGDRWRKHANLRALLAWMWAHPGKKLLFMGCEIGQWREWSESRELDWYLLQEPDHRGLHQLVADLNARYRAVPALWERDADPQGFEWIDANNADANLLSFVRYDAHAGALACIANMASVPQRSRFGLPRAGRWVEVLNTDAAGYGGSNVGNYGGVDAEAVPWHGMAASAEVACPPLGVLWLRWDPASAPAPARADAPDAVDRSARDADGAAPPVG